jgi:hypothetical protein
MKTCWGEQIYRSVRKDYIKPSIVSVFLVMYLIMNIRIQQISTEMLTDTRTLKYIRYMGGILLLLLLSLAPQPSLGLGLLLKIRLNFLDASQQFFYRVGLLAPRPTPIPEDQASVFISPRGRVATHFSHLLRHAWVTVGLFFSPVTKRGYGRNYKF